MPKIIEKVLKLKNKGYPVLRECFDQVSDITFNQLIFVIATKVQKILDIPTIISTMKLKNTSNGEKFGPAVLNNNWKDLRINIA